MDKNLNNRDSPSPRAPTREALAYDAIEPALIASLRDMTRRVGALIVDIRLRTLVEVRVSQLNACAYCIDLHTREALAHGESVQRLVGLNAWHESVLFDEREAAALGWAEALTLPSLMTVRDTSYAQLSAWFSQVDIVHLTMVIALANAWNRIAGGLARQPTVLSHHS